VRYLVLSDIHGNLEALEAVLADAAARGYDAALVLGDLVGYGADPNAVIDRIRAIEPLAVIRGNHDKVASGIEDAEGFNAVARSAVQWTYEALSPEHREYVETLPPGPQFIGDQIEICHGTPYDEDAYVFDELDALRAIESATRPVCLFGHTHLPIVFIRSADGLDLAGADGEATAHIPLAATARYLVNPGSVGQPRDGDPRAAYAVLDMTARAIELYRIAYPVETAQYKIREAGLPEVLARRLGVGR
jgi:predicted phosphodiesterase